MILRKQLFIKKTNNACLLFKLKAQYCLQNIKHLYTSLYIARYTFFKLKLQLLRANDKINPRKSSLCFQNERFFNINVFITIKHMLS